MLTKRIIPCLDVKNGSVVKGVRFKNHEVVGSILDLAKKYNDEGADELVFTILVLVHMMELYRRNGLS